MVDLNRLHNFRLNHRLRQHKHADADNQLSWLKQAERDEEILRDLNHLINNDRLSNVDHRNMHSDINNFRRRKKNSILCLFLLLK